jgi:hypothetical protein
MMTSVSGSGSGSATGYRLEFPGVNPSDGNICPEGGENLNNSPAGVLNVSVMGLKERLPENAIAVTMVGLAKKFMVLLLPSFLERHDQCGTRHQEWCYKLTLTGSFD